MNNRMYGCMHRATRSYPNECDMAVRNVRFAVCRICWRIRVQEIRSTARLVWKHMVRLRCMRMAGVDRRFMRL